MQSATLCASSWLHGSGYNKQLANNQGSRKVDKSTPPDPPKVASKIHKMAFSAVQLMQPFPST